MTDASALASKAKTTLKVRPANYGVTHLYWSFLSSGWDSVTLVRNLNGYPTAITDGETLYTWTSDPSTSKTYLGVTSKYHFFDTGSAITSSTINPGKGVTGTSLQGKTAYYALFMTYTVSSNQYVTRSAFASTPVIKDDGMLNALMNSIPAVYKADGTDLQDFIGLFAFHLSLYKQQATNVFDMHNPLTVDSKLLAELLNQFGASLYGGMSVAQGRTLLANLIESYTQSGSTAGIKNFIELYSGYSSYIATSPVPGGGVNMVLDYNSASFVESTGNWYPSIVTGSTAFNASAPYAPFISWIKSSEASVVPYGTNVSDAYQGIFKDKGFLKITAVLGATQDVTLRLGSKITIAATTAATAATSVVCKPLIAKVGDYVIHPSVEAGTYVTAVNTTTAALTLSNKLNSNVATNDEIRFSAVALDRQSSLEAHIPVAASTAYTFSAFFNRGSYTGKSVKLAVMWYDKAGTLLSTSTYGTTLNTASGSANTWQGASVTATSPVNSKYAMPIITFISCVNGDIMYVDGVQFEAGSGATTFQDARVVNITVQPNRINEVLNPSFETNTTYWWTSNDIAPVLSSASGAAVTTRTTAAHVTGSYAGSVTLTTPAVKSGNITKGSVSATATVTTVGAHGYTTGDTVYIKVTGSELIGGGVITTTSTNVFTVGAFAGTAFSSASCIMYKANAAGINIRAIKPSFNELVPVSSASYDLSGNIVVNTAWPIYFTAGSTVTGGSTVPNDMTDTNDVQTTIISVDSATTFTTSSSGTNTSSLFDNNAYVFSTVLTNFFMSKNIYFNNSTTSATVSGITIDANSQYVFNLSAKLAAATTGVGVAALPYIITNPNDNTNYRIDNLPTISGVSCVNNVATFYTNTPHQFLKSDKVQIFGLPSTYYVDAANTVTAASFNTTNANTIYTITEVGDKYFKATRTTAMTTTAVGRVYFNAGVANASIAYAMWDISTNWVRMSVPGNSIGLTLGANNYTKAIAGLYVVQTFDTNNTGATLNVLVDNALLEKGGSRNFYFDGHYDGHALYDAADRDTRWEGTADASRSYYYKDLAYAQARLKDILPDSILYGSGTLGVGPGWAAIYNLIYSA
jgi:hypothetical protein